MSEPPRTRLSRSESFRVMQWLVEHKEECSTSLSMPQAIAKIKTDTHITLRRDQLKGVVRDAGLEITWRGRVQPARKDTVDRPRAIAGEMLSMAKAIEYIIQELGLNLPPDAKPNIGVVRDIAYGNRVATAPTHGDAENSQA